ncbi:MAG: STAS domain-containing protein [Verrucomicrobiota bacterium]
MSSVIEGQIDNGTLKVELGVNRLDAASSRDFKKEVDQIWSDDVQTVEMDFDKVDFIDSSGVGALLGVYKRLPQKSATVRLNRVKAPVQSVIELLRLHRIFEIQN